MSLAAFLALPSDGEGCCRVDGEAAGRVGKACIQRDLAVERIPVIGPVEGAAQSDAAPQPVTGTGKDRIGNVDLRALKELVIDIGNGIKTAAGNTAVPACPGIAIVGRYPKPALQALCTVQRDMRPERIGETVKRNRGPDELCLRCQRPAATRLIGPASLKAQGIANPVIAFRQPQAGSLRDKITVISAYLCLAIHIEPVLAKPCQAAAQAIAGCADGAIPVTRADIGRGTAIMD